MACCNEYINKISLSFKGEQNTEYKYQKFELKELVSKAGVLMKELILHLLDIIPPIWIIFLNLKTKKIKKASIV